MRARRLLMALFLLIALVAAAAYALWVVNAASRLGAGWAGLASAWPYLLAGVATVGVAIAGFARLALFSARKGYDDRADPGPH